MGVLQECRGSKCHGYDVSKRNLDKMGIDKKTHCDCEIIFNAKPRIWDDN
ncbi:MAG: hypothetical protein ACFE9S_09190 [Candidatus Hermodarchaeota archaeon]